MTFDEWVASVPAVVREDSLWKMEVYRLGVFMSDLAWMTSESWARIVGWSRRRISSIARPGTSALTLQRGIPAERDGTEHAFMNTPSARRASPETGTTRSRTRSHPRPSHIGWR